jgi:cytoplasmic iron level regulating protein YaaA (DUF328/UPF0246 family)
MKLVISPAKSLNYSSELPTMEFTQSCFLNEAEQLNNILKSNISAINSFNEYSIDSELR